MILHCQPIRFSRRRRPIDKIVLVLAIISALMLPGCARSSTIRIETPELETSDEFARYELVTAEGYISGKAIGSILQVEEGEIEYVVFSPHDPSIYGKPAMIGLSGNLVPVPWALLACDAHTRSCSLDVNQQIFELAPRIPWRTRVFDRDLEQTITAYWSQAESSQ